jgi:hypothetical protein
MPVLLTDRKCPFCGRVPPGATILPARRFGQSLSRALVWVVGLPAMIVLMWSIASVVYLGAGMMPIIVAGVVLVACIAVFLASWRRP